MEALTEVLLEALEESSVEPLTKAEELEAEESGVHQALVEVTAF